MQHTLIYNDRLIKFKVIKSKRKSIGIIINPDCSIIVKSPKFILKNDIYNYVLQHSNWIIKHLKQLESQPAPPKIEYHNGTNHWLLGNKYKLELKINKKRFIEQTAGYIIVYSPLTDADTIKKILKEWYRSQAKVLFKIYTKECFESFDDYNLKEPEIFVRKMKSRWGSCSSNNKINLNLNLIKYPPHLIKYVIIHELCHLIHLNHSKEYYNLLTQILPNWKEMKKELNECKII